MDPVRPVLPRGPRRASYVLAITVLLLFACSGPGAEPTAELVTATTAPPSTFGFRDPFDDINLTSGWFWVRENPAGWSLADRPGWLRLDTGETFMLGAGGDTPLLLYQAPSGDFEVRTLVDFTPGSDFQFAGVLIYGDDDHFVSLGYAHCGLTPQCVGTGIYLDNDEAFIAGLQTTNGVGGIPQGKAIWLRLVRTGTTYTAYWSLDGETWAKVDSTEANFTPESAGLMATNGRTSEAPISAYFDLFQVNAPPTTVVERGGVCAESMDDLEYVSHGYLASGNFLATLGKPSGFQAESYLLMISGVPYECTFLEGRTDRIYCTGRVSPQPGLLPIQLMAADSSCSFLTPFDAISVIPKAEPTTPGPYD